LPEKFALKEKKQQSFDGDERREQFSKPAISGKKEERLSDCSRSAAGKRGKTSR